MKINCAPAQAILFLFTSFYSTSQLGSVFVLMTLATSRLPASGDFCHLLIIFSNYLDPDHDGHSIGLDLDPNSWTSDSVPNDFFKVEIEKDQ